MSGDGVVRLRGVSLVVADLAPMAAFYCESFGFEVVAETRDSGAALAQLLGLPSVHISSTTLRLGADHLELAAYGRRGRDYPSGSTAADLWFQHIAIVVADMDEAYGVLRSSGAIIPISTNGPEHLPPNTGGVTAFKFRDPEGHPLELSMFPPGVGAERWLQPATSGNCLGIDHSALSVSDISASLAFYSETLGMSAAGRSLNRGAEQDRLDGLACDGVDIVALQPADAASPHIELLGYPDPRSNRTRLRPNDIAATRLLFQVSDLPSMVDRLRAVGAAFISPGAVTLPSGAVAVLIADPDGHLILLSE
jgi:catechol 2,3-dioxygenase-like lactoylglutathione lyase family enzyme